MMALWVDSVLDSPQEFWLTKKMTRAFGYISMISYWIRFAGNRVVKVSRVLSDVIG
jgi:hypothetical protein